MAMPVTFALTTLLLREHNRCCDEMAPEWNPSTDEVGKNTGVAHKQGLTAIPRRRMQERGRTGLNCSTCA